MISAASQVLERHTTIFQDKGVLFNGFLQDDFPWIVEAYAKSVKVSSAYYDYVTTQKNQQRAVEYTMLSELHAELIVYYWSKNKAENMFQLKHLLSQSASVQEVLIVGENRSGVRSIEKLLSPYGHIRKIDSARRCSLYYFQLTSTLNFELAENWTHYAHPLLNELNIYSLPGVFSADELDWGSALLIKSTQDNPVRGRVLDLGCGAGVIGSYLAQKMTNIDLVMSDISAMAIEASRRTLSENALSGEVVSSDIFSEIKGKFNAIISNPPFHEGVDTAYKTVETLINKAATYLSKNGELRIVANAFLPYPELLEKAFGNVEVLAKNSKFKVYRSIRR